MTRKASRILLSIVAAGLSLIGVLWLQHRWSGTAYAAPAATDLFASTTGSLNMCTQAMPCQLDQALSQAVNEDRIYIAQGTYTGTGPSVITLTQSITLCGGWDGVGTGGVVRDPDAYPTILDGEDERRAVFMNDSITPTIDGFHIIRGNASNADYAPGSGGGIYSRLAVPIISNNVFSGNVAYTSTSAYGFGGGLCVAYPADQTIISGNEFYSNVASTGYRGRGGGLYVSLATPSVQVVDNTIVSNTASITGGIGLGGGLALAVVDGAVVMSNTIENNTAAGTMDTDQYGRGGGIWCTSCDSVSIKHNIVQSNTASLYTFGSGGGIHAEYSDGLAVVSNTVRSNVASDAGPGSSGGGLAVWDSLDVTIDRNLIVSNAANWGGGLDISFNTAFSMTNNVVARNSAATRGGGLDLRTTYGSYPVTGTLVHNTFALNDVGSGEGRNGIEASQAGTTLVLTNNIVCTHSYGIVVYPGSTAAAEHTLLFNNYTADTLGIVTNNNPITGQDPLLDSTYHLTDGSPAILAGLTLGWPPLDIDGEPRRLGAPDIGADDHQYPLDYRVLLPLVLRSY
jgi:hypothetical protein